MAKKNRNRKANKKVERFDGYTVTSWIDKEAGNTPEEREAYWYRTHDQRYASGEMNGTGFRSFDVTTGRQEDYTFDDLDACKRFLVQRNSLDYMLETMKECGITVADDQPVEVGFPSLGIGKVNLRHPKAAEFVELAVDLSFEMRAGTLPEFIASARAMTAYMSLGLDQMPDVA